MKKIKQISTALMALAVLALPAVSFANTYQYVSSDGNLLSVTANNSTEALAIAPNIALHSGVMLANTSGTVVVVSDPNNYPNANTGVNFYQYIDVNGDIRSINASSASVALATAPNIAPHSGVIVVTNSTMLTN